MGKFRPTRAHKGHGGQSWAQCVTTVFLWVHPKCDFMRDKAEALEKNRKFLQIENNNIKLNKEYYYISNSIISDLI